MSNHASIADNDEAGPTVDSVAAAAGPRVVTLGCRLNAYESEVIRAHALAAGLDQAIIVNTCAVTREAVTQASQTIRKLRRENPSARLIVTGCAVQTETARFEAMPEVDNVIGNHSKLKAETFAGLSLASSERVRIDDIMSVRETAGHLLPGFGTRVRVHLQIQNGCDHRCTFCIIPFGRGPSRSVPAGEVVSQIRQLVADGAREVVLTGVDITSYGAGLPGTITLGKLVAQILKHVPELPRLRLSSIDQVEADADLLRALADEPRLMPHLHLSLQAGDDMILKRMKRRHLRADAIRFCEQARRLRPDVVFGGDLIAGFPTETEAMFENSLRIIDECGLTYLHVFPFSPRTGTPAARMPQLGTAVAKARAARLREVGRGRLAAHLAAQVGRTVEVLQETPDRARTEDFAEVVLAGRRGEIVRARIMGATPTHLIGEDIA